MKAQYLPLRDTGFVSGLICDYLEGVQGLKAYHNGVPSCLLYTSDAADE